MLSFLNDNFCLSFKAVTDSMKLTTFYVGHYKFAENRFRKE